MAIEKVEMTAKFKKTAGTGGGYVAVGGTTTVTGEGGTSDAAQAVIKGKIEAAIVAQQGVIDDLNDANSVA